MTTFNAARRNTLQALGAFSALSFLTSSAFAKTATATNATKNASVPTSLQHLQNRAFQGGVALLNLGLSTQTPQAIFNGERVLVLRPHQATDWWAVVGISLSTEPGTHPLSIKQDGQSRTTEVSVAAKSYPKQHITLKDQKYVSPPEATLLRIKEELKLQSDAYQVYSDFAPSNLLFDPPVPGRMSSPFGFQRIFNGEPRNPHAGLDFAAPIGTPVKSPANGKILLIGDYFFNGKTVFVDHGMGLISMFCHLSQIDRQLGDSIKRGDVVAKVGNTGRSTGPHLHWNVSLNNARVDPAIFLRQQKR